MRPDVYKRQDLCDGEAVDALFASHPEIDAVIHFAAYKAVGESVQKPLEYYTNNLGCTLTVLNAMRKYNVKNFVFSSSATVYGDPASVPITEDFPTGATTNPYGTTKVMICLLYTSLQRYQWPPSLRCHTRCSKPCYRRKAYLSCR